MSDFETIIYEKSDGIGRVTLNRPKSLNTYNIRMRDELYQVLGAIKEDPEVRVTVFRGAGNKAFCAGADLSEFLTAPSPVIARQVRWERDVWGLFMSIMKPFICALHGFALGDGLEIALCCDLRLASDDVKFGLPEPGLGIIPAAGGSQNLPRNINTGIAMEMLLAGRWLSAGEACRYGLVNRIVPRAELWEAADELAVKISSYSPAAVSGIKEAVRRGLDLSLSEGLSLEARLGRLVRAKSG